MKNHIEQVIDQGYCIIKGGLSAEEAAEINIQIDQYISKPHEGIVFEQSSNQVRGIHGAHLFDAYFDQLIRDPRFIEPCQTLLNDDVYLHQFKVNMKQALTGESWPWHQDSVYWQKNDNINTSRLMNVAIFLNHTELLHGPLCVIPGSHKHGDLTKKIALEDENWENDVSVNLTYQLEREALKPLIEANGTEFMVGEPGDILIFDPQLAHCSFNNLSVDDRRMLIMTYNAVSNKPNKDSSRPEFISSRNYDAIVCNNT